MARNPERDQKTRIKPYKAAAGGWGSVKSLASILQRERNGLSTQPDLFRQNKPHGFACVSCAWAKPAKPHIFEYCENGAKATAWELSRLRVTPEFFAEHSVAELLTWTDFQLEQSGRLMHPMRIAAGESHYRPVSWEEAFQEIGSLLQGFDPAKVVFYASGRAANETAYMYALFARLYGCNNLPDSSNMCHETTSVALPESIGIPVGTVILEDFSYTDLIFFFGQNTGSNSPRMLHQLQDARKRGAQIITFNPLREKGLEEFTNPQNPIEMLVKPATQISTQYHQVKTGGDAAALMGLCKALIEIDARHRAEGKPEIIDRAFIAEHTHGFDAFLDAVNSHGWQEIVQRSGLRRAAITAAATVYATAPSTIACYGMGLTQHRNGVETVQLLANLLLMRGNIGRQGAGICPVRGHSNVQGQRTVGITEKPQLVPLDKLAEQYEFEPPRNKGMDTVAACEAVLKGDVQGMFLLGGNLVRAVPDRLRIEPAWAEIPLTVTIATKLNRTHIVHGKISYILPCLGRTEADIQASGPQAVSVEDSTACIHGSIAKHKPASPTLLSEPAIVAGIAKAALSPRAKPDWDAWVGDYRLIRAAIAETYPEIFHDYEARMWIPGGFHRPLKARHREWTTKTGKANFIVPKSLVEDDDEPQEGIFRLMTLRSNDQFNTTIYGYDDRFRGIHGTRMVLLLNKNDMARLDIAEGATVTVATRHHDGFKREMTGFRATTYDVPEGCCGAYYPEANALLPMDHYAKGSKTPAAKSIAVTVQKDEAK